MNARAYILMQAEASKVDTILHDAAAIPGVREAEPLAGSYDLVVLAEDATQEDITRHITRPLGSLDGVFRTITCFVSHDGAAARG